MMARTSATWLKTRRGAITAGLAMLAAFTSLDAAKAAVLETYSVDLTASYNGLGGADPTLLLPYYSGTGTLREVDLSYAVTGVALGFVTQESESFEPFGVELGLFQNFFVYEDTPGPAALHDLSVQLKSLSLDFGEEDYDSLPVNTTALYGGFSASGSDSVAYTRASDVSSFVGGGFFPFLTEAGAVQIEDFPKGKADDFLLSYDISEFGDLTLTYIGDPAVVPPPPPPPGVPEPGAWAMMLVGFGGLGGALRLRRRRPHHSLPMA